MQMKLVQLYIFQNLSKPGSTPKQYHKQVQDSHVKNYSGITAKLLLCFVLDIKLLSSIIGRN